MDSFTVAILGAYGVGKTALALRFALNSHNGELQLRPIYRRVQPTVREYRRKVMVDGRRCEVHIIQIWGDGKLDGRAGLCIERAHGFLLVYSISSRATFNQVEGFRQMVVRAKGSIPPMIVVGNKLDEEREITVEEAGELAARFGCPLAETSTLTAENVNRVFVDLARMLRNTAGGPEPVDRKNKHKGTSCVIV
ncbi:P-loop containing nucleoside triphosphate hydrolase protein [Mycena alexandri]|uniref:P-loop containing nucleoside triphosphate hydrolase protein n=1 Tax=Mycena alexandri TaxID=1745969 RepID=A0AAD6S4J9_9AGAR|nr:P-loop containing nucleoside triphosphate hydrolase protein [Mycena alexandri]